MISGGSLTALDGIAIIGMAGQFPGAKNVDELWQNLVAGVESIRFFSDEEMLAAGVDPTLLRDPNYVKAAPVLDAMEWFDPGFFGFTPREAEVRDPQHRLFLEAAHVALEHSGYDSHRYEGSVGVFGGVYTNRYAWLNVRKNPGIHDAVGSLMVEISNHADYLSTLVSYKLNLRGPSLTVATACSTSLVAAHLACQSLRQGECEMALAGGVEVELPYGQGYLYGEGGIFSADGHCRSFDAKAAGTIFGNGVGVVVLKRLTDALADRDRIYAVIRGSAINNDGAHKVGFTAPGVEGQVQVIAEAYGVAGVDPRSVSYVEAHGTATALGDPIEVAALTQVFRESTPDTQFCAIGSVKSNVGHLGPAAGVTGLIKTSLALDQRLIPPSLHYEQPNPKIDFENSPFFVNTGLAPWDGPSPRRAGVSSFGIGGTNAHLVLEEAPPPPTSGPARPWQLLILSARSAKALDASSANLAGHLREHPELNLADAAYTLQVGRGLLNHRRALVCQATEDVAALLDGGEPKRLISGSRSKEHGVAFMFPGQGAQSAGMARDLYANEPAFRSELDRCAALLEGELGRDIRDLLLADAEAADQANEALNQTALTQPAMFAVEYALARLWISWGLQPVAMIGHSIGEYVAACLAGVISLEDALRLVAERGRLMQALPSGAMLSVALSEADIGPLLNDRLALAAVNAPTLCVVSGPHDAIEELEGTLLKREIASRRLHTSHAFHSPMMDPVVDRFKELVGQATLGAPAIPFISNVTGTWISDEQATDPGYWATHLRQAVRFADGVAELVREGDPVLLEVGPGQTLTALARQQFGANGSHLVVPSMRHVKQAQADSAALLTALARLWVAGVVIDWPAFSSPEERSRVALPTYPFEKRRCWVDPISQPAAASSGPPEGYRAPVDASFYTPAWREAAAPVPVGSNSEERRSPWLVFADEAGIGRQIVARLEERDEVVAMVLPGDAFASLDDRDYQINPANRADYDAMMDALRSDGKLPRTVVHCWSVTAEPDTTTERCQELGFFSLLFTAQALAKHRNPQRLRLYAVSNHLQRVSGEEPVNPGKSTILGPVKVIPKESIDTTCHSIDVALPAPEKLAHTVIDPLLRELFAATPSEVVAFRGGKRWLWGYDSVQLNPADEGQNLLTEKGVYLITGGMGGIGLVLAEELARRVHARLVLMGRSSFPTKDEWPAWLESHDATDKVSRQISKLMAIESLGGDVMVASADVADEPAVARALTEAEARFGRINGVIHAAGVVGGGMAAVKDPVAAAKTLAPKVHGTEILAALLAGRPLDFFVLISSITSVSGDYGLFDYVAANSFLDGFAHSRVGTTPYCVAINYPAWLEVGMAVDTEDPLRAFRGGQQGHQIQARHHPLIDGLIFSPEDSAADGTQYITTFSAASHWVLDEHRLEGRAILPGVAYLEMARAAFADASGSKHVEIHDTLFLSPLQVKESEQREVRTRLKPGPEGMEFSVVSRDGPGFAWQSHAVGALRPAEAGAPAAHDLAAIRSRCNRAAALNGEGDSSGIIRVGPRWQNIKMVHQGDREQLVELELPEAFGDDIAKFGLHPALLDCATAFGQASTLRDGHFLPFGYGRVKVYAALPPRVFSHIRQREDGPTGEIITSDIVLMDEQGNELVAINGFVMRRVDPQSLIDTMEQEAPAAEPEATPQPVMESQQSTNDDVKFGIFPAEGVEALRRILSARLGPQVIVCVEGLQRKIDRTAKVTRASVEEQLANIQLPVVATERNLVNEYVAPSTELEQLLATLWQENLGVDKVGVEDDFFELGGNSLVAVQVASRVRARFQVELALASLFESPTVRRLAQLVEKALLEKAAALSEEEAAAALQKLARPAA